jgi:hypothetical protein
MHYSAEANFTYFISILMQKSTANLRTQQALQFLKRLPADTERHVHTMTQYNEHSVAAWNVLICVWLLL